MSAGYRAAIRGDLVGRDFARVRPGLPRPRARLVGWLLLTALVCALSLVALRIDILRLRYALGAALDEEKTLLLEQRQHTATLEALRDPSRLVALARERGFGPPERILELRAEAPTGPTP